MRFICGVVGILAAAWLATAAFAIDLPPVPTLPTVTVPTLPLPPVPTVPTPAPPPAPVPVPVPAPVTVPKVTTPVPAPPAPAPAPAVQAPPPPAASYTPPSSTSHTTAAVQRARRQRASRRLLRPVIAHLKLAHATRIRVTIKELSPDCHALEGYVFRAPKGRSTFHFPAARATAIGTYELVGTTPAGREVFSVRARRLSAGRVLRGGTANACGGARMAQAAFSVSPPLAASSGGQLHVKSASAQHQVGAIGQSPRNTNPIVRAVTLSDAPASVRPLLLVLLAFSIALLGTAAVPQRVLPAGRTAAVLTQRRAYLAAAGIWLLAVVVVVTVVS